jgi:hypothetical protein
MVLEWWYCCFIKEVKLPGIRGRSLIRRIPVEKPIPNDDSANDQRYWEEGCCECDEALENAIDEACSKFDTSDED